MKSILSGLSNGQIVPWELRGPQSDKCAALLDKIEQEQAYFTAKMPPDDAERFLALSDLHAKLQLTEQDHIFANGFTLGLLLALEISEYAKPLQQE